MNEKEILERSKEIALMLGYKITLLDKLFYTWKVRLKYEKGFLMEIIEEIKKIQGKIGNKENEEFFNKVLNLPIYTDNEELFIEISNFAKFYNKIKKL